MSPTPEHDMIAARAMLTLRALRDAMESHIVLVRECTNQEEMTAILFALGDMLKQQGRSIEKLATRSHGLAPQAAPLVSKLPSTIPPEEEPEEEAYHSYISGEADSGVRKAAEHPGRQGLKL